MAKFTHEIFFNNFEVLTPEGFKDFKGIGKTVPYRHYEIHFKEESERPFICADTHIVIMEDGLEKFTKDLKENDRIKSTNEIGYLTVKEVVVTDKESEMFDLLGVEGEIYNTDNIVSHNSTVTVGYALYRVLFHSHENIFILAQSGDMAKELLSKVKTAYENLPHWLQQGVSKYNEFSIWLENGSKITARTTSKNAVRGRSATCVTGDSSITIRDKRTGEIIETDIDSLKEKLQNE